MPQKKKTADPVCAGCPNLITNSQHLKCAYCHQIYDLLCANVDQKTFTHMTADNRGTWKCPDCCNKQPKGDNSNTPARTSNTQAIAPPAASSSRGEMNDGTYSGLSNITTRTKQRLTAYADQDDQPLTIRDLRSIIREELQSILKAEIDKQVTQQLQSIRKQITEFQESITFYNEQFEDLKRDLVDKSRIIKNLVADNEHLKATVSNLTSSLGTMEQQMRSTNLEIQCVPEDKSENLIATVLKLSKTLQLKVEEADISQCMRISKLNPQSKRPRSILVNFTTRRHRDEFVASAARFNKDKKMKLNTTHLGISVNPPQPVYVVEHLTAENKDLHAATRARAKELGFKYVWIRNGKVFMRKSESSRCLYVRNKDFLKTVSENSV